MSRTASSDRCSSLASSPSIASPRTCSHGSSIVRNQCSTCSAPSTLRVQVACGDRRPRGEEPGRRLVPRPVQRVVQGAAACGQLHRSSELALMGHDVGQVVAAARLQLGVARRFGDVGSHGDVVRARARGFLWRLRSTPRAGVPSPDPGAGPRRLPPGGRSGSVGRLCCRRGRPRPSRTRCRCRARAADRARRSRPARRRCWRARSGRRTGAGPGGGCAPRPSRPARGPRTMRRVRHGRGRRARPRPRLPARTPGCCREADSEPSGSAALGWRGRRGRRCGFVVDDHQGAARQPADDVDRCGGGDVERFEHELHRRQRRAAGEGGECPQAALVVGEQQVVAPSDG